VLKQVASVSAIISGYASPGMRRHQSADPDIEVKLVGRD
jgi:hypothetical protein